MSDDEFNRLLNGPLAHPLVLMRLNLLSIALRVVVKATGEAGERALREHCAERDRHDIGNDRDEHE